MAKPFPNPKDPADVARYWYDFSPLITKDESLTGQPVVTALNDADTITLATPQIVGKRVYVEISEGLAGKSYKLEFVVSTSEGQTFNREAVLKVKNL